MSNHKRDCQKNKNPKNPCLVVSSPSNRPESSDISVWKKHQFLFCGICFNPSFKQSAIAPVLFESVFCSSTIQTKLKKKTNKRKQTCSISTMQKDQHNLINCAHNLKNAAEWDRFELSGDDCLENASFWPHTNVPKTMRSFLVFFLEKVILEVREWWRGVCTISLKELMQFSCFVFRCLVGSI